MSIWIFGGALAENENIQFDSRKQGLIRALLYPVIFEKRPLGGVDRALCGVVDKSALGGTPAEYREAIRCALGSGALLRELGSETHTEGEIAEYLQEVGRRLDDR